ncbi:MAG: hypothetical protein WC867_00015 [Candidatus Pacearchaeota archaeon]|jgi:parallel beta-helix repeat protein
MVYKRYIKKNGKLIGPYYYESYRTEDGRVISKYLKDYKPESIKKNKDMTYLLLIGFFIFLFLVCGNILFEYNSNKIISGKVVSEINERDLTIAKEIANQNILSDIDLLEESTLEIKDSILEENDIMEFNFPDGSIELSFDLLNSNFYQTNILEEIIPESFLIDVDKDSGKYKWGYQIPLKEFNLLSRITVRSNLMIEIVDENTLKIGNNYLSFSDLKDKGYEVNFNQPNIDYSLKLSENNLEINQEDNQEDKAEQEIIEENNPLEEILDGEIIDGEIIEIITPLEEPSTLDENTNVLTGFIAKGFYGINGLVGLDEANSISVYIQKDFTNENDLIDSRVIYEDSDNDGKLSLGDIINLDPSFIAFGGTSTNSSNIVFRCGTINESGSYIMNQSFIQSSDQICINITADDVILNCNSFNITAGAPGYLEPMIYSDKLNTSIRNCIIIASSSNIGIVLNNSESSFIYNNSVSLGVVGLYVGNSNQNIIQKNIFSSASNIGISLIDSSNNNFSENNCSGTSNYALFLQRSDYNNFSYNNFSSGGGVAKELVHLANSDNNLFYSNSIYGSNIGFGFSLINSINNTLSDILSRVDLSTYSGASLIYLSGSTNNIIKNSILNSTTANGNYTYLLSSSNIIFINCSYDLSREYLTSDSELFRQWYYQTNIIDNSGIPIINANLSIYNYTSLSSSSLTSIDGFSGLLSLNEYVNIGGDMGYNSNYSINISKIGYLENSSIFNLSRNYFNQIFILNDSGIPPLQVIPYNNQRFNNQSNGIIRFEVNSTDNLNYCRFSLDNWSTNISMGAINNNSFNFTNSTINDGSYNIKFWCNDSSGYINDSMESNFSIESTIPQLTIVSPRNTTYSSSGIGFIIGSNDNLSTCKFSIDYWQTNYSMNSMNISYFDYTLSSVANGGYLAKFWCNDSHDNSNYNEVVFVVSVGITVPGDTGGSSGGGSSGSSSTSLIAITGNKTNLTGLNQTLNQSLNQSNVYNFTNFDYDKIFENNDPDCGDWSDCITSYDLKNVIYFEEILLRGYRSRLCIDRNSSNSLKVEKIDCVIKSNVYFKKSQKCFKEYLEVYGSNDSLVSRIQYTAGEDSRLNIQFALGDKLYCPYCYNGIKDYDEENIDCGGSCPKCNDEAFEVPFYSEIFNFSKLLSSLIVLIASIVFFTLIVRHYKLRFRLYKLSKMQYMKEEI